MPARELTPSHWSNQLIATRRIDAAQHLDQRGRDEALRARARRSGWHRPGSLPLYGIPFAIKDNIDSRAADHGRLPGLRLSTARLLAVVQALHRRRRHRARQDQSRPVRHRAGRHPLAARRLPQRLRSRISQRRLVERSAVAVALGLASFALGTDTAGSGRVPAAFNNLVGYKPTLVC
jgi:allophanate hydrolase